MLTGMPRKVTLADDAYHLVTIVYHRNPPDLMLRHRTHAIHDTVFHPACKRLVRHRIFYSRSRGIYRSGNKSDCNVAVRYHPYQVACGVYDGNSPALTVLHSACRTLNGVVWSHA